MPKWYPADAQRQLESLVVRTVSSELAGIMGVAVMEYRGLRADVLGGLFGRVRERAAQARTAVESRVRGAAAAASGAVDRFVQKVQARQFKIARYVHKGERFLFRLTERLLFRFHDRDLSLRFCPRLFNALLSDPPLSSLLFLLCVVLPYGSYDP